MRSSLYLRFAVLAGVALALAGTASVLLTRADVANRAQLDVYRDAAFMAQRLGRDDLARTALGEPASGDMQVLLDDIFGAAAVSPGIVRVTLTRPDGTVTYSSDHELIGMPTDRPDLLQRAFDEGRAYAVGSAGGRKVLVSYVPVRWLLSNDGRPSGVVGVYRDYAPVAKAIRDGVRMQAVTTALALLLLYAALFPILRSIKRTLAARNREKVELERRLGKTHRAEAVGRLAGSVAHDFNNLLTGIGAYADLIAHEAPSSSPLYWHAEEIRKATARGAALTRHLLDFESRREARPQVLDLNAVVGETLPLLQRLFGEDVKLDVDRAPGVLAVDADPVQLEQLVVNLVLNARDAIPGGGTIVVRTRGEAGGALLSVSDSAADSAGRHGLELAALWELVRSNGGTIEVAADPGAGTAMRVCLPLADGPVAEPRRVEPEPAVAEQPFEHATVLLVEDEEIVRAVVREVLETAGYTVLAARHGRQALEVWAEHGDAIDVVVSDVVMPEVGGIELAAELRQTRPGLGVILMSGYPDRRDAPRGTAARWLQKPFTHDELLHEVVATLAERGVVPA
jgi:CheY-like chemotaxis protein